VPTKKEKEEQRKRENQTYVSAVRSASASRFSTTCFECPCWLQRKKLKCHGETTRCSESYWMYDCCTGRSRSSYKYAHFAFLIKNHYWSWPTLFIGFLLIGFLLSILFINFKFVSEWYNKLAAFCQFRSADEFFASYFIASYWITLNRHDSIIWPSLLLKMLTFLQLMIIMNGVTNCCCCCLSSYLLTGAAAAGSR